jgi:hypothetical protein
VTAEEAAGKDLAGTLIFAFYSSIVWIAKIKRNMGEKSIPAGTTY